MVVRACLACAVFALLIAAPAHAAVWGKLVSADGKTMYPLEKPVVVIGSDAKADVVLAHATVSARHCRLTYKDGHVMAEDLGSRFATLLDGTALKKGKQSEVFQKSDLALGAVSLTFEFGERPALLKPLTSPKPAPAKHKRDKKEYTQPN